MEEKEMIDQTPIAEAVAEKIPYTFRAEFLVKPLEPVMVKKEFSKPVTTGVSSTDENGITAEDYDSVETEVKEVESDYKRGIVLKLPVEYVGRKEKDNYPEIDVKVGDVVVYRFGRNFDLVKDTQIVSAYEIIAVKNA